MSPIEKVMLELRVGKPAILPTETVYGLMARADDPSAIDKIYALKGRAFSKPLALCVKNIQSALDFAILSPIAIKLAEAFWPGPLTLVVEARTMSILDRRMIGPDNLVGLRCPDVFWRARMEDMPLALTSANKSGEKDTLNAKSAYESFGDAAPIILDGGQIVTLGNEALPSTVIAITDNQAKLLRAGPILASDLAQFDIEFPS